jgi:23S rRNA pseudouridine1911/1915/1917 synthase
VSWHVADEEAGERLDRHLAGRLDVARNRVRRWIDEGRVTVNGAAAKPSSLLRAGDEVAVEGPDEPPDAGLEPEAGELAVIHEDADLAVIDKPAGLAVHPGAGRTRGTLAHHLLHRYPETAGVGGPGRPGIVHRLDRDTTGVLVIARTDRTCRALVAAFAAREVEKTYVAIVYGTPRPPVGRVELPIGRDPRDRKRMAVISPPTPPKGAVIPPPIPPNGAARPGGRPAATRYRTLETAHGVSRLELGLETGRTHQIRVHLKAMGHPLVGDPTYGEARWRGLERRFQRVLRDFPRPALHAFRLAFVHPGTGERVAFTAPVPEDMERLWREVVG